MCYTKLLSASKRTHFYNRVGLGHFSVEISTLIGKETTVADRNFKKWSGTALVESALRGRAATNSCRVIFRN